MIYMYDAGLANEYVNMNIICEKAYAAVIENGEYTKDIPYFISGYISNFNFTAKSTTGQVIPEDGWPGSDALDTLVTHLTNLIIRQRNCIPACLTSPMETAKVFLPI